MAPSQSLEGLNPATRALHADQNLNNVTDVTPPIHVTTTFRYSDDPATLKSAQEIEDLQGNFSSSDHVYSRISTNTTARFEAILTALIGNPTLCYSSGLSAFHAALVLLNPHRIVIGTGYHGCQGVLNMFTRLTGAAQLALTDEASFEKLEKGDLVHIETPNNPTGTALNIAAYAEKAHTHGAFLSVDSTFAPPGLQNPFALGADLVIHSGSKYFGGHSDLLCGTLSVGREREDWVKQMISDRVFLGSVMGGLESWLGVRSLRTLELRVQRQSQSAGQLVAWLADSLENGDEGTNPVKATVESIQHASLQKDDMAWLSTQMPNGFGPVFAIMMKTVNMAKRFPGHLQFFHHATSLGGVESLIEWRAMSDKTVDPRLLRVSIGLEHWEDLKRDFEQAFRALI